MIARVLVDASIASDPRLLAAQSRWEAQLFAEGWSVAPDVAPAGATVAQIHAMRGVCDHLQLLGPVAVPQVRCNPDGHGLRPGDCDAPYATDDLSLWKPQPDGSFAWPLWPADASCSVSRIDLTNISADPAGDIAAILDHNVAYRTGAYEYDGLGVMVQRFDAFHFPGLTAKVKASLEAVVGAGNVLDATSQYPDERFFETYAGRRFLVACLFSGGDQFRQPNGVFGHVFYVGSCADAIGSPVPIAFPRIYCSYGWEFERWPFQHALLMGGALAVVWDPGCDTDLSGWDTVTPYGQALRKNHRKGSAYLWTVQGDATLCRRAQDMGVSLDQFNGLVSRVAALETSGAAMSSQIAALKATAIGSSTTPLRTVVDCGGPGDSGFSPGSLVWSLPAPYDLSGVTSPLPASAYNTGRGGPAWDEIVSGYGAGQAVTVRLHLVEPYWHKAGQRVFTAALNGGAPMTIDIFALAGFQKAVVVEMSGAANAAGNVRLDFAAVPGAPDPNTYVCAIEVLGA